MAFENSKWIWRDEKHIADTYGEFKVNFVKGKGKTVLRISADSEYAVFVNKKFVYGGQYADFPWYKVYDEIDITQYLKDDENECLIWAWHCGYTSLCRYVNRPALRFEIVCDNTVCVGSGKNILSRAIPQYVDNGKKLITPFLGYSFSVDYTENEEDYSMSTQLQDMPENVIPRPIKLLTILSKKTAKKISEHVYDLGEELVGFPFVKLKAPYGQKVVIAFGEWLNEGKVPRLIANHDFSYTVIGDGRMHQTFNPLRKIGCRYFEIEGNAEVGEIGLLPLVYPFSENSVEIDNPIRKKIYDISVRTLKLNAMEHYYDCPWREQGFYALDSRHQMRYASFAFKNPEYPYAAWKLMSEDRHESGMISITVPTSEKLVIPSFTLFYVIAMEEYASSTGDIRLIEEYFCKIIGVIEKFIDNMQNGLVYNFKREKNYWNFYEWNDGLDQVDSECDCALNLTFLLALKSLFKICDMLEKNDTKSKYLKIYNEIAQRINDCYYDENSGLYRMSATDERYFELINAYAILTGVVSETQKEYICEKLISGELVCCTLSMASFKYDALLEVNREKYKNYILADIDKNYTFMLEQGATSFWETIYGAKDFGGAGSLCHGWAAAPILYYHQLGVVKNEKV